jgi:NAD(P)-dependent dehydrogenase (short-subunit alcohol dehydrogenase family)
MEKLSGKTALVTGSTDGVGRLVARKLGQAGASWCMAAMPREALARLDVLLGGGRSGSRR